MRLRAFAAPIVATDPRAVQGRRRRVAIGLLRGV